MTDIFTRETNKLFVWVTNCSVVVQSPLSNKKIKIIYYIIQAQLYRQPGFNVAHNIGVTPPKNAIF